MKLNKQMKALVKALIATASEPLKKQIEDLEYQVKCANAKATNLEAKNMELSSALSKAEIDLSLAVEARDAAEDRVKNLNENFKDLMSSHERLGAEYDKLQQSKFTFKNSWANLYEGEPKFDVNKPNRQILVRSRGKNKNAEWRYILCSSVTLDDKKEKNFEHQWCYLEA